MHIRIKRLSQEPILLRDLLLERNLNPLNPSLICMLKKTVKAKIRIAITKLIFISYYVPRMQHRPSKRQPRQKTSSAPCPCQHQP
jgi:hypothetical protein